MIPELGHYALVLALALGLIQAITPIVGARGNDAALMGLASSTSLMQFAFVGLAFLALIVCYVTWISRLRQSTKMHIRRCR